MVQTYSSSRFSTGVGLAGAKDPPKRCNSLPSGLTSDRMSQIFFSSLFCQGSWSPLLAQEGSSLCVGVGSGSRVCPVRG